MYKENCVYEMLTDEFKINTKDAHIITLRIKKMVEDVIPVRAVNKFCERVPVQVIARCGGFNSCRNSVIRGVRRMFLIIQNFE